ncbi:tryptophan-rich sensory protein [bacterium]|nr:tryptophan-rich sensory protein [bacterium]
MFGLSTVDSFRLLLSLFLCLGAGVIGSLFTRPAIPVWYQGLKKPSLTPPGWVFAPVWVTLYLLMGLALFLIWRKGISTGGVRPALAAFALQLALNAAWSGLFFGLRSTRAGLTGIALLWVALALTIYLFLQLDPVAAALLLPYLLWVSFAARLTWGLWRLNR